MHQILADDRKKHAERTSSVELHVESLVLIDHPALSRPPATEEDRPEARNSDTFGDSHLTRGCPEEVIAVKSSHGMPSLSRTNAMT